MRFEWCSYDDVTVWLIEKKHCWVWLVENSLFNKFLVARRHSQSSSVSRHGPSSRQSSARTWRLLSTRYGVRKVQPDTNPLYFRPCVGISNWMCSALFCHFLRSFLENFKHLCLLVILFYFYSRSYLHAKCFPKYFSFDLNNVFTRKEKKYPFWFQIRSDLVKDWSYSTFRLFLDGLSRKKHYSHAKTSSVESRVSCWRIWPCSLLKKQSARGQRTRTLKNGQNFPTGF